MAVYVVIRRRRFTSQTTAVLVPLQALVNFWPTHIGKIPPPSTTASVTHSLTTTHTDLSNRFTTHPKWPKTHHLIEEPTEFITSRRGRHQAANMSLECRIRPFNPPSKPPKPADDRPDLRKPPVLWISRAGFEALERATGGPASGSPVSVLVERLQHGEGCPEDAIGRPLRRAATVLPSAQDMKGDVVKITRAFMEAVGFHTGDLVRIELDGEPGGVAEEVAVVDVSGDVPLDGREKMFWELGAGEYLSKFPCCHCHCHHVRGSRGCPE